MKLNYVLVDEDRNMHSLVKPIEVLPTTDIDTLQNEIYTIYNLPTPITTPGDLTGNVWRPLKNINVITLTLAKLRKTLKNLAFPDLLEDYSTEDVEYLKPFREISSIWKTGLDKECVHIILCVPRVDRVLASKRKREHGEEHDAMENFKRMKTEVTRGAPSTLAEPDRFQTITGPNHGICINRPFEYSTIPLTLLDPIFPMFKDRCKDAPSEMALACLSALTSIACQWHSAENQRRDGIASILKDHLGINLHPEKVPQTEFTTDGNLSVVAMPALIRKCKNEQAYGLNQAVLYYTHWLIHAVDQNPCLSGCNTCFPCILMVDIGTQFGFYGVAWDGKRARAEPLTPVIDLTTHWNEASERARMASTFDALLDAIKHLQSHYTSIVKAACASSHDHNFPRQFPFVTSYTNDDAQPIGFAYNKRLDDYKLVFSAIINPPRSRECIVKYVHRYCVEAHHYLASEGYAPAFLGSVRISNDWMAVIMEKSSYEVLYTSSLPTEEDQAKVQRKVQCIVQALHEAGFVHGDIRSPNVLFDPATLSSNDVAIHFIDFDWAGRIGEAKYPPGLNRSTVKRPEGARSGELITMEHDNEMVTYMFTH